MASKCDGVSTYLFLVDPETLTVKWANPNVENFIEGRDGESAVGRRVEEVVLFAEEFGLLERIERVKRTGEPETMSVATLAVEGRGDRADGSIYPLPSEDMLVAAELTLGQVSTEP